MKEARHPPIMGVCCTKRAHTFDCLLHFFWGWEMDQGLVFLVINNWLNQISKVRWEIWFWSGKQILIFSTYSLISSWLFNHWVLSFLTGKNLIVCSSYNGWAAKELDVSVSQNSLAIFPWIFAADRILSICIVNRLVIRLTVDVDVCMEWPVKVEWVCLPNMLQNSFSPR